MGRAPDLRLYPEKIDFPSLKRDRYDGFGAGNLIWPWTPEQRPAGVAAKIDFRLFCVGNVTFFILQHRNIQLEFAHEGPHEIVLARVQDRPGRERLYPLSDQLFLPLQDIENIMLAEKKFFVHVL